MRTFGILGAVVACGLLLAGCETLNEDQCRAGDWQGIGYTDGANGHQPGRFGDHVKACSKYQIMPDQQSYLRGRDNGLSVFCKPERGFTEGRLGREYGGVCPIQLERGFLAGYDDGKVVWDAQQRVERAESDISTAQTRWDEADQRLREMESRLRDGDLAENDRAALRESMKRVRDDRRQADTDMDEARYRRDESEREVNDLRYRFGPRYGTW